MKKYILGCLILISNSLIGQEISSNNADSLAAQHFFDRGDSLMKVSRFEDALEQFTQAESIYKKLASSVYIKCITKSIECNFRLGRVDEFEGITSKILSSDSLANLVIPEMVSFHMAMGPAEYIRGDIKSALDHSRKAALLNEKITPHDYRFDVSIFNNLGILYEKNGDPTKSIEYSLKAIILNESKFPENLFNLATTYGNIGGPYIDLGMLEKAQENFNKAIQLTRQAVGENHPEMARRLGNLGNLLMLKGEYDQALDLHNQSMGILIPALGREHFLVSRTFNNLGRVYNAQRNFTKATFHYQEALKIRMALFGLKHQDVALINLNLGENHFQANNLDSALHYYQKALIANVPYFNDTSILKNPRIEIFLNKVSFLDIISGKASSLSQLFEIDNKVATLMTALRTIQSGDTLVQVLRRSHLSQLDKIALGENSSQLYELALNVCSKLLARTGDQSYKEMSFYFAERGKAAVLTEAISDQFAKSFASIPDRLIAQEKNIKINQNFFRTKIQNAEIAKKGYDTTQLLSWKEKLFNLNRKLDSLTESFQQSFPKYYDLKYSNQTMTVEEVQDKLNDNEAFLEYLMGDSASYVFSITKRNFDIGQLTIDSSRNEEIAQFRQTLQSSLTASNSTARFIEQSRNLYIKYLSEVINGLPDHIDKLTIVGDGALSYVPFDILLTNDVSEVNSGYKNLPYLLKRFRVSFGHSAKLLFQKSNAEVSDGNKNFIAFAPSYSGGTDSLRSFKYGKFRDQVTSLKWNTPEIEGINEYMNGTLFSGKEAVEKAFKSSIDQYNIVHLAMHALIDDEEPMNSKLIFSQVQDSTEDNFLHAYELYNMELPAQMVVLSACETGFGKLEKGEGVMSLARAFAYAGCPSVVMSHWSVNDATTAKVMTKFYKHLSDGYSKDGALRQAKLDFLAEAGPAQANPLFWGSFVVMGDTAPINEKKSGSAIYILAALILFLGLIFIGMRRKSKRNQ